MKKVLNITNGDSAVELMREAELLGDYLPWRDVLHEGPVPKNKSLDELSEIRANYIVERGWGSPEAISESFMERDKRLKDCHQYDKVMLWFEHDLYDQLQILQVLDWFYHNQNVDVYLTMVCVDQYLGMQSPETLKQLMAFEKPVSQQQLVLANRAWAAFCESTPENWNGLLNEDTSALPFLEGAIVRLLEEYPGVYNGLSRTAMQSLNIMVEGQISPGKLFGRYMETEERQFLGDLSYWGVLQTLLDAKLMVLDVVNGESNQLPCGRESRLTITPLGITVLSGEQHFLEHSQLDYWIGGVHLTKENMWYWDSCSHTIIKK